ncbi:MAG: type II toxin-antitoxin system Phd/YefM family antitoxin [Erysipelotrichaceae bacterium]|nr:type II toxin-antitoxin system Phd/YefM family antitoxin [Erysipelotrichaceae bacterium]
MITVSATNMKNLFGKYLDLALRNGEIYISRNGRIVARLVAYDEEIVQYKCTEEDSDYGKTDQKRRDI